MLIVRAIVRLALVATDDPLTLSAHYYQWDLSAYYYGPLAFRLGRNPYDRAELTALAGAESAAYVYPPLTLLVFWPLTVLTFPSAYYVWLLLKVAALAGLGWVWSRWFVGVSELPTLLFLAGFAFNSTLIRDLNAGNVSALEQLGLWLAIALIDRDRLGAFGLLIITISQFKVTPVLFLLLLVWRQRPQWIPLVLSAGAAAVLFSLNLLVSPRLTSEFIRIASVRDERGALNPSSLALIRDALEWMGAPPSAPGVDLVLFLCVVVMVWGLTICTVLKRRSWRPEERTSIGTTTLLCFAYALTMPRFKDYSYMLLLIPTWRLLTHSSVRWVTPVAWVAVLASSNYVSEVLWQSSSYMPLATAFMLWALSLVELHFGRR